MPASGSKSTHGDPRHIAACKLYAGQMFTPWCARTSRRPCHPHQGGTAPLPRSAIGTVLMGGALSATLAALVHPGILGVQNVSSDPPA